MLRAYTLVISLVLRSVMQGYIMHRTQVLIEAHQYQRLRSMSADSGRSIGSSGLGT